MNDFWLSYGPWKYNVQLQLYHLGNAQFLHITEITPASIVTVKLHFFVIYPSVCSSICLSVRQSKNLFWLLLKNNYCDFIQTLQEWLVSSLVVYTVNIFTVFWSLNNFYGWMSYCPWIKKVFLWYPPNVQCSASSGKKKTETHPYNYIVTFTTILSNHPTNGYQQATHVITDTSCFFYFFFTFWWNWLHVNIKKENI